jgi:glycosyltransferase involved in cell wall biosynthesis/GT2 family glycosyltransferase
MAGQLETDEAAGSVDVVVPVYRAADALDRCLASILLHTSLPPHRLIVVVDGPQPENVEEVLARRLDNHVDGVRLIRTAVRSGFVAAVNRGMSDSARDVVLLNSDTEVTAGWLDKLQVAAYSAPKIATVTPLSNNATICSLPEFLEDNYMPAGISTDMMGDIVEHASCRRYPRLPTGVGVCLYIRRKALDEVGLFDEATFGLGYGEENEFCNRSTAAGFEHLADDATFIFHAGQQSFGADTARRRRAAMRTLRSMDRSYIPRVAAFIETDPMAPVRERVVAEIERRRAIVRRDITGRSLSILHIVHGWPPFDTGGTEVYARRLAQRQAGTHRVSAFARIADDDRKTGQRSAYLDHGIRVRLVVNNFDRRNPIARNALKDRAFERELELFIGQTEPDLVHVHHLAGHCASLMGVVRRHGIPIVYQVQDWWALCARANLWRSDDTLCPGPGPGRCARCLPLTALPPRSVLNRALYQLRRRLLKHQLRRADAYVMGSRAVLSWHSDAGLLDQRAPAHVLEYGVPDFSIGRNSSRSVGLPITFGFIGTVMPHKGAHVAVAAFRGLPPDAARLVLWGNPDTHPDFVARLTAQADSDTVDFKGRFDEDRKPEILASLDVLIVPSVGLESFGIVAREAMSAGVPVLASRRGALEELDIDGVCGATFSADDPADLRRIIDRLIESPEILTEWRRALPEIVTVEEHADEIEKIYRQVLRDAG